MLGSSYRRSTISLAGFAHDSPRRKAGSVLTCGCVEKRAAIAQTARMRTGGIVPALSNNQLLDLNRYSTYTNRKRLIKLGLCNR